MRLSLDSQMVRLYNLLSSEAGSNTYLHIGAATDILKGANEYLVATRSQDPFNAVVWHRVIINIKFDSDHLLFPDCNHILQLYF